jgi:predicted ATPase
MQLKRFKACGVHGYLNFDISFHDDITFLTGINGSGKTTVVQSIISLITPSLLTLSNLSFESMSVDVENDGADVSIVAERQETGVTLRTTSTDDPFTVPQFVPDPDEPLYRNIDRETQFYLELTTGRALHPVIQLINSLPTPMFLDLDRRARSVSETDQRRGGWLRPPRRARNVFNVTLTESLLHATALAESRYRQLVSRLQQIGEESRRAMVLSLLTMNPETSYTVSAPTRQDRATIKNLRQMIDILPNILQISRQEVNNRVLPFLEKLESITDMLPLDLDIEKVFRGNSNDSSHEPKSPRVLDSELIQPLMLWSSNQENIRKLNELISEVERYNTQRDSESSLINQYLGIINGFLNNSGKSLAFNSTQNLVFTIENAPGEREINTLSSGEAQLFVILTHLFFNPAAQRANVFIIDEPELSLHVQWQELFVESISAANPRVQYVLATHSPSIILERTDKCLDLGLIREQRT